MKPSGVNDRGVSLSRVTCMDDRPDGLKREPPPPLLQGLSVWLGQFRLAQKIRAGGSVRIPGMNPLAVLVVVVALVAGGVWVYRTYVSGPASRCERIEEAFDLVGLSPPPLLTSVPEALRGTSVASFLLSSMKSARKLWGDAVRLQDSRNYSGAKPADISAQWSSWVAGKRATVLAEQNC